MINAMKRNENFRIRGAKIGNYFEIVSNHSINADAGKLLPASIEYRR
jgi:hypothetical protein